MTIKLKKIELNGFRGSLHTVSISFPNNGDGSIILYGEGGSGKTTFTEGVEWFYKDKIDSLEREFCGKECYFNLRLDNAQNATVNIEFNQIVFNSTKTLYRTSHNTYSNRNSEFKTYLEASSRENFILRHHDLKDFVDEKTKAKKLEYFAKLIGFEKVTETRTILVQAFNALKASSEINVISGQLKEAKKFLVDKLRTEIVTEEAVLAYVREQLKLHKPELQVLKLDEIPDIAKKLYALADTSAIGKRKHILELLNDQFNNSEKECGSILGDITVWMKDYKTYLKDIESIQKESLLNLYTIGKRIITSRDWLEKEKCPLCGSVIDDKALIEHLSAEIVKIESSLEKKKELEKNFKVLSSKVSSVISKLKSDIENFTTNKDNEKLIEDNKTSVVSLLTKVMECYQDIAKQLSDDFKNLRDVSYEFGVVLALTDDLKTKYKEFISLLQQEINSLVVKPEIQRYIDTAKLLENFYAQFERSMKLSLEVEKINEQADSLQAIQEAFEEKEKEVFQKIISVLSKDIDTYYGILNPGEGVDKITLFPTEDKGAGRGLEISYKFHGTEQYPAKKYLSESHRNSLGISIFLASAKHFNKINKFLILDDIYTSLDVNHRERLVSLFTHSSLSDKQFLITTHDLIWFKTMQRTLQSNSNWKFMEIRKWRIDTGIEIVEAPESIRKRILDFLNKGEIFPACKSIRSYFEETLKRIAKKLEIRVPYREDARWEPSEFYSGIRERISSSSLSKEAKVTSADPALFIANLATHENDVNITSGTIKSLVKLIDDFEKAFHCDKCQKNIWHAKRSNSGFQCQCGKLQC
ncbi:MAG: hypothetical protein FJ264_13610 [Planctomycetes bacterium]|nr:hypothetical protein [Planctomycetota bacterium]